MAFFGHFWAKNAIFLGMAAPEPLIICSKNCKTRFFESSTLEIGYGALPVTTQATKTLFYAKKWLFLAKKCVFLVMAALKPLIICSKTLQKTSFGVQHPENRVWGPTTDHSGPKNAVLGYKMAFFGHFWAKNAVFLGDGGSERLNNLLQNLAKHAFLTPAPSK